MRYVVVTVMLHWTAEVRVCVCLCWRGIWRRIHADEPAPTPIAPHLEEEKHTRVRRPSTFVILRGSRQEQVQEAKL